MDKKQYELNKGLAQMLKGSVIMDVTTPEQAKIAEAAGACAVMALERIPADIRAAGGVSRMSDPKMIKGIQEAVSIPVMAKCRIGHFVEAQLLQAIEIDYIDESEVLSPADDVYHIDKTQFQVPFVCGARDLGEALRRINEGASMIRTKGEPGTGDVVQAVRHMRKMNADIRRITSMRTDELFEEAKQLQVPYELVLYVQKVSLLAQESSNPAILPNVHPPSSRQLPTIRMQNSLQNCPRISVKRWLVLIQVKFRSLWKSGVNRNDHRRTCRTGCFHRA